MKLLFFVSGSLLVVSGCDRNSPQSPALTPRATLEEKFQARTNLNAVVEGNTAFAVDMYHQLRTKPGNLFLSPYSLSSALAMTYAGARGETERQMARTLHFTLPQNRVHGQLAELQASLNAAPRSNAIELLVASSLWPAKGLILKSDYLDRVRKNYQGSLKPLDFGQTEAARQTINRWVEEQTRDKIKELFKPGLLDPGTVLVLANAIYFKGAWATPFNVEFSQTLPFHLSSGEKINATMMHDRSKECGYHAGPELQLLELPYEGDRLSMIILLPTKVNGLTALEQRLTAPELQAWVGSLQKTEAEVWLPRFKAAAEFRLDEQLKVLGMMDAFSGAADFSGMFESRGATISAVVHKAIVEVNEAGTEAAAATGVVIRVSARPIFRADHPFLFLIRDRSTSTILFLGRIVNPQQSNPP